MPESGASIESTHSMIVEIVYSYGLIGALIFLRILMRLWRRASDELAEPAVVLLKRTLLVALAVSFGFDSYPLTAQILWFTPLLFSIIAAPIRQSVTAFRTPVLVWLDKRTT
jgi:ABC-type arginine transport system permease subunit